MDDLSFEINAPKNLKSKQTGSRKKFPELSSKSNPCNKENKKSTKSIKLWDPNEDIKKFLNKKPRKASVPQSKLKTVENPKKEIFEKNNKVKPTSLSGSNKLKSTLLKPVGTNPSKSTFSTGYVSSNESYKSTTYEFSGNSRDGSANLSDDSLVKIFKSKLPTSVKINKILTPGVNNVKIKSSTQSSVSKEKINQGSNSQKSKKIDFAGEKLPEPAVSKEKNDKGSHQDSKKLDLTKGKSSKLMLPEQVRHSINFRNSTDFNTFATPLKTTNSKISTPTELETTPNSKIPLHIKCIKSPLAQNENTKRQKVHGANFVIHKNDLSKKRNGLGTSRRTHQQKTLLSTQDALEKQNSSKSSESRNSSLHSSLSSSPSKNCRSSLFSTISMDSKESHDSSGSVYISATETLSPTTECNLNDRNSKKPERSSKETETTIKTKQPNYLSGIIKITNGSTKTKDQKIEEDDSKQIKFNARQLRSITNNSLFTTISSNESISVVNSRNVKHFTNSKFDSRKQNNKSSSLIISGIEKLNLTEDGKENKNSNLPNKSPALYQSLNNMKEASRNSLLSEVSNHSSLFSSINSSASITKQKKTTGEVITISSDSSFDIDVSLSDLNIKETVKESIICNDTDNLISTKPNSKTDTHASLYSTIGNANLTCGVKISKSKYFFNSSDKSISSIGSEPSCIESSIMPSRGNFKKMAATPELDEAEKNNEFLSKDNLPRSNLMNHSDNTVNCSIEKKLPTSINKMNFELFKETEKKSNPLSTSKIQNKSIKSNEKSCNIDAIFDKTKVFDGEKWVEKVVDDCDNIILLDQNEKNSKPHSKGDVSNVLRKTDSKSDTMDALFDKTKFFDGKTWVDNVNTDRDGTSFKFKEPKNQLDQNSTQNEVDLSTWGKSARGNVKIKLDRYSLNFNFNRLIGKTETTSTETLENFSSDVKHCDVLTKRKSINRDLRKSIEVKRSIVISSDSEADTDDEIRVVSKARRKQRILESSDENSCGSAKAISSNGSEYEDIRPKSKDKKSKKCPLADLTNEFDDLLTIHKKPTEKAISSTPKTGPTVQDKKSKGKAKQLTAVPNTPFRNDKASKTNKLTFLDSLSDHIPDNCIPHPEAAIYKSKFKSKKEELARRLFHLYNKEIFGMRMPADMPLEWNGRMRTTSGFCYNKRLRSLDPSVPEVRSARIALSKKILDRPDRLRDTLVHELCHAASWLVDGVRDGHGPNWRKWTIYAMQRFPELPPIKRCHEYKIDHKYVYRCSQCDYEFGRHSKSLNLDRQVCGYCHGKFVLLTNTRQGQTATDQTSKRPPTQFAMFVKENYAKVKQENAGVKHGDVMRLLSKKFAESKAKDS